MLEICKGVPAVFCFKDAYNKDVTGIRDPVQTRAIHGEERALLTCDQDRIKDGYLFTTSSPCEMCAKNAKEHRIDTIYYIEPYPGISQTHICDSGDMDNRAKYQLFEGAIGRAYTQLYSPLMPLKDELKLRGIDSFKRKQL
jgi:deoxycytidylate deaminase